MFVSCRKIYCCFSLDENSLRNSETLKQKMQLKDLTTDKKFFKNRTALYPLSETLDIFWVANYNKRGLQRNHCLQYDRNSNEPVTTVNCMSKRSFVCEKNFSWS